MEIHHSIIFNLMNLCLLLLLLCVLYIGIIHTNIIIITWSLLITIITISAIWHALSLLKHLLIADTLDIQRIELCGGPFQVFGPSRIWNAVARPINLRMT